MTSFYINQEVATVAYVIIENDAGKWIKDQEWEANKWEFFDADGIQLTNDRITATRWGAYGACETSTQTGDINIPNAEIIEIIKRRQNSLEICRKLDQLS